MITERRSFLRSLGLAAAFATFGAGARAKPSSSAIPAVIRIPAGPFITGSDKAERDYAYALDAAAYGSPITRKQKWYDGERPRGSAETGAFEIARTPVTNAQYAAFVAATGHPAPDVDPKTWQSYGFIHPYERTRKYAWVKGKPPRGREQHPVVLVSHEDAVAYGSWLSRMTRSHWRLPTELEWEKAARGTDGRYFPWGKTWNGARLDSADEGPFDTVPVGRYPAGASPFGMLDATGLVYEWTATTAGSGRFIVKGGSWDDKGCGICRPAARSSRPGTIKHIIIGIRVLREMQ